MTAGPGSIIQRGFVRRNISKQTRRHEKRRNLDATPCQYHVSSMRPLSIHRITITHAHIPWQQLHMAAHNRDEEEEGHLRGGTDRPTDVLRVTSSSLDANQWNAATLIWPYRDVFLATPPPTPPRPKASCILRSADSTGASVTPFRPDRGTGHQATGERRPPPQVDNNNDTNNKLNDCLRQLLVPDDTRTMARPRLVCLFEREREIHTSERSHRLSAA